MQTRTKLRKSFKGILNCFKLQIVFKSQRKLANVFQFKDRLPFDLVSRVVYKYTRGRCNSPYYGETDMHFKVRSGEHTGISALTFRKVKPSKESEIRDHLLNCNNTPSFDEFTILAYGDHKYILETKENLLIKRDRPDLNKNISSANLFLFDNNQNFERFCYTVIFFCGSKVDSAFHPSEVDKMSTRNFWELLVKRKLPPRSGCSLEAVEPHP